MNHKKNTSSVVGCSGTENISNDELLQMDVDVLVLAALEGTLTEKNAGSVRAKVLVELANGPTTPEADEILYRKGVHVIPDFLCNAGGVTVSYFEMVQNAYMFCWDEKDVHERLDKRMTRLTTRCWRHPSLSGSICARPLTSWLWTGLLRPWSCGDGPEALKYIIKHRSRESLGTRTLVEFGLLFLDSGGVFPAGGCFSSLGKVKRESGKRFG